MFFLGSCSNHFDRRDNGYPTFTGGWPLAINTTTVDGLCPSPKPGRGFTREEYVTNTYAIADGIMTDCGGTAWAAAKIKLAQCRKRGFKNVQARKVWHGRVGFGVDPSSASVHYLTMTVEFSSSIVLGDYIDDRGVPNSRAVTQTSTVDPSTGKITFITSDSLDGGGSESRHSVWMFASVVPDGSGGWTISYERDNGIDATEAWFSETEIHLKYDYVNDDPRDDTINEEHASCVIKLSDPFTADAVESALDDLLGFWDLDDDVVYPFRTDSQTHHAPLVCYDEIYGAPFFRDAGESGTYIIDGGTGRILGKPLHLEVAGLNRGGNQPFWNSNYPNTQTNEITGNVDIVSRGAYAPGWCINATHWTEETSNLRFVQGAFFAFNNPLWPMSPEWKDWQINANTAIKTKWCEVFLWEYPAHNYARPCGADDRAKMDGGTPRWPDAPCFCNDPTQTTDCDTPVNPEAVNPLNTTKPKGDFCIKRFQYDFKAYNDAQPTPPLVGPMSVVSCEQHTATRTRCQPTVIYIQKNAPSRPGSIHISEPSRPAFDPVNGGLSIVQIVQRMVDPLWKEGDSETPPMEECRNCAEAGGCAGYIDSVNAGGERDFRCEPEEDKAWL